MAGLPKKYAKMGFKKGWAAYRRSKGSRKASRTSKPRKVKRMARRRSYSRRRRSYSKKFSMWKMMKGAMYTGAVALPMYQGYQQLGGGTDGAIGVLKAACFIDPATGKFSAAHGTQIWMPVAVLSVVDFATTKLPIQRQISRGINKLLG